MKGQSIFGDYIKEVRARNEITLRSFCRMIDEDPSNWSKIERGKLNPPQDIEKLKIIAKALKIKITSEDFQQLKDKAQISMGKIPDDIMENREILNALPVFMRTIGSVKPKKEEIEKLIQKLKKGI